MTVFIQLLSAGANVGPFNLYSNLSGVPFAVNISRATLLAGDTYNNVPDGTTIIQIESTGVCENSIYTEIDGTTTTTTTAAPETFYRVAQCIFPFTQWTLAKLVVFNVGDVIQFITSADSYSTVHCGTIIDDQYIGSPTAEIYSAIVMECGDIDNCEIPYIS